MAIFFIIILVLQHLLFGLEESLIFQLSHYVIFVEPSPGHAGQAVHAGFTGCAVVLSVL